MFVSISYNQNSIPDILGYLSHFAIFTNFYTEFFSDDSNIYLPTLQSIVEYILKNKGTLDSVKANSKVSARFVHYLSDGELKNADYINSICISAIKQDYTKISNIYP